MLRVLAAEFPGGSDDESVPRQDHDLAEISYPVDEVVEQPAQVRSRPGRALLTHQASSLRGASESGRTGFGRTGFGRTGSWRTGSGRTGSGRTASWQSRR